MRKGRILDSAFEFGISNANVFFTGNDKYPGMRIPPRLPVPFRIEVTQRRAVALASESECRPCNAAIVIRSRPPVVQNANPAPTPGQPGLVWWPRPRLARGCVPVLGPIATQHGRSRRGARHMHVNIAHEGQCRRASTCCYLAQRPPLFIHAPRHNLLKLGTSTLVDSMDVVCNIHIVVTLKPCCGSFIGTTISTAISLAKLSAAQLGSTCSPLFSTAISRASAMCSSPTTAAGAEGGPLRL